MQNRTLCSEVDAPALDELGHHGVELRRILGIMVFERRGVSQPILVEQKSSHARLVMSGRCLFLMKSNA